MKPTKHYYNAAWHNKKKINFQINQLPRTLAGTKLHAVSLAATLVHASLFSHVALAIQDNITLPSTTISIIGVDNSIIGDLPIVGGSRTSFTEIPNLTGIQRNIANTLDTLCNTTSNTQIQVHCTTLLALSNPIASDALDELAPDEIPAQITSALILTNTHLNTVAARLQNLRYSTLNKEIDKFLLSTNKAAPTLLSNTITNEHNPSGGGASADNFIGGRTSIFFSGQFSKGDKDSSYLEQGYDFDTQGLIAGADYHRTSSTSVLGGALGYSTMDSDFHAPGGNQESTAWTLLGYGTHYLSDPMYLDWIVSYGDTDHSTNRNIPSLGSLTTGSSNGNQYGFSLNAGADFNRGNSILSPYGRIEFINATIDAYTESGGAGFAIHYDEQKSKSLTTAIGGRFASAISSSWGILSPSIYAEWIHEFEDDSRQITSHFVSSPSTPFSVQTDAPDRNYFNIGTAIAATFSGGKSAFINYDTTLALEGASYHRFDIGFRMAF